MLPRVEDCPAACVGSAAPEVEAPRGIYPVAEAVVKHYSAVQPLVFVFGQLHILPQSIVLIWRIIPVGVYHYFFDEAIEKADNGQEFFLLRRWLSLGIGGTIAQIQAFWRSLTAIDSPNILTNYCMDFLR